MTTAMYLLLIGFAYGFLLVGAMRFFKHINENDNRMRMLLANARARNSCRRKKPKKVLNPART